MPRERFTEPVTTEALARLRAESAVVWAQVSRPFRLTVGTATSDVLHGMGVIPTGFLVAWTDGVVTAAPGVEWTSTAAYLVATAEDVHVTVIFYTLQEDSVDA